jgi:hypothetical protein
MEDLTEPMFFPPGIWGMFFNVIGADVEMQWIAVDDIGAVAAAAFDDRDRSIGQTINLAGDKISTAQAYALFGEVHGKRPFRMLMPRWFFRYLIPRGRELVEMCEAHRASPWDWDTTAAKELHPGMMTMRQWLERG